MREVRVNTRPLEANAPLTVAAQCVCGRTYYGSGDTLEGAGRDAKRLVASCVAALPGSHKQYAEMAKKG